MDEVSGSIKRINYPRGFIGQFHNTKSSSSFFTNELRIPVGTILGIIFKRKGRFEEIKDAIRALIVTFLMHKGNKIRNKH